MKKLLLNILLLPVLLFAQQSDLERGLALYQQGRLHDAKLILEKQYKNGNDDLPLIKAPSIQLEEHGVCHCFLTCNVPRLNPAAQRTH